MSRSIARILMIVVACAALVALGLTAKAGATSANPVAWMASDSGPLAGGQDAASPATTPSGALAAQDGDSDGDSGAEATASEGVQDNEQQSEQGQEQELSGVIASVDAASSAFTLTTASGVVSVSVNGATQYEDGLSGLASLRPGLSVTVKGAAQALGQTLADEVKGSADTSSGDSGN